MYTGIAKRNALHAGRQQPYGTACEWCREMKKRKQITYKKKEKSMTNQEIEKVSIAMAVLIDDMNVEEQMVAVTTVMQAVRKRGLLKHWVLLTIT